MIFRSARFAACYALFAAFSLAGQSASAQAYVNQANGNGAGSPAYVDQMPPGARSRAVQPAVAPRAKPRATASSAQRAAAATSAVASAETRALRYPSVGTGSTAIVRSATEVEWPSVGRGTVNR